MTCCVSILLDSGLVFLSDSRTRADVDQINIYFRMIRGAWGEALREAFSALPNPDWLGVR